MFRRLKAKKDTYITNKIINNSFRVTDSNMGQAATLDLFKLSDESKVSGETEPKELTRILIRFDLDPLRELTGSILDITNSSFKCTINLKDVIGGQTIPSNFKVISFPLSQSFDEGNGKDVYKFQDIDACNFVTASISGDSAVGWFLTGANAQGLLGSSDIDIISSGNLNDGNGIVNLWSSQTFELGTEDLSINVTKIISGVLAGQIPDHGFRLSFSGTQETDDKSRFVKRFASSQNNNTRLRPALEVKFNDTLQDHSSDFIFNTSGSLFINNKVRGQYSNIVSGSGLTDIIGNESINLKLVTGSFNKTIVGGQHSFGTNFMTGIYSASFALSSFDTSIVSGSVTISDYVRDSGSITFATYWNSIDGTISYHTGSLKVTSPNASTFNNVNPKLNWNIINLRDSYRKGDVVKLRISAFDRETPITYSRVPVERKSEIFTNAYYRIKDHYSDDVIIPFDTIDKSTNLSSDSTGMFFDLYTDDLDFGRVYTIDVMLKDQDNNVVFNNVGGSFRIDD